MKRAVHPPRDGSNQPCRPFRIQVVHEFGAFGAVDPAVVAPHHPVVLLIGASGKTIACGRRASARRRWTAIGDRLEDPPDELDDDPISSSTEQPSEPPPRSMKIIETRPPNAPQLRPALALTGIGRGSIALSPGATAASCNTVGQPLQRRRVACDISDYTYQPPPPPLCARHISWGSRFVLEPGKAATIVCHGDTVRLPGEPTLDYGQTKSAGTLSCDSEPSGVKCTDSSTGHYFRVSRDSYDLG